MTTFSTKINDFMSDSRDVIFMNDVYANNVYLTRMLNARGHEVSDLNRHAQNKTQLSKVGYLSASYHIHVMRFRRKILLFSMFMFLVAALLFGLRFIEPAVITENKTFFIALSVVVLLYVIMIMIWYKDRNQRSSFVWHRYYFASPKQN